ncbi:MAG: crossover junction endodeoxyribonuclease RuvC [Abditibacteriota bacterium]|nr:crossover junction endodeoxyribonuclease RuvC [Abditibacteriota bacterium]
MRILGLDPGTAIIGFGVIDHIRGKDYCVDWGTITTPKEEPACQRLLDIYTDINSILTEYMPDQVAIERLFYGRNTTTAIEVAKACGVLTLAVYSRGLPITEYTPMEVKSSVTGYGKAEKQQVQYMITNILGLSSVPKPDDAADALAIAICHSHSSRMKELMK